MTPEEIARLRALAEADREHSMSNTSVTPDRVLALLDEVERADEIAALFEAAGPDLCTALAKFMGFCREALEDGTLKNCAQAKLEDADGNTAGWVTVQMANGKTPMDLRQEALDEVERLRDRLTSLEATAACCPEHKHCAACAEAIP